MWINTKKKKIKKKPLLETSNTPPHDTDEKNVCH